jgi:hypothetical protein
MSDKEDDEEGNRDDFSEQKGDAKWKTVRRFHDFESPIEIITTKKHHWMTTPQKHHRQPLWLHRFLLAPCVTQTHPVIAWLGHFCAMRDTNSSLHDFIGTPLEAASFLRSTMCDTHSTLQCLVGTFLKAANINISLCAVRDTNSSPHGLICASLMVALLVLPYASLDPRLRFVGNLLFFVYLIFTLRTGDRN